MDDLPAIIESGSDSELDEQIVGPANSSLRDLEFTDLYFAEKGGQAFLRGTQDSNGFISSIPGDVVHELDSLFLKVKQQGQHKDEFRLEAGGISYRVRKIRDVNGSWFTLRRVMSPTPSLSDIRGIRPIVMQSLSFLGRKASGLILFAGRTGNGKTTTASALLKTYLLNYGDIAVTIEDPPELPLSGNYRNIGWCFQEPVLNHDYASALAGAMRMTPKYIYLGEIRRPAEASEALRAGMNGHLIISTIHAASVQQAIESLQILAAKNEGQVAAQHALAECLTAVIHQRLGVNREGRKVVSLDTLFLMPEKSEDIRAKIRQGKIEMLKTDVDRQARLIANKQFPLPEFEAMHKQLLEAKKSRLIKGGA